MSSNASNVLPFRRPVPRGRVVSQVADLALIHDQDTNLCVLPRDGSESLTAFADACLGRPIAINRTMPTRDSDWGTLFAELSGISGFDAFIEDVTSLAELYTTLLGPDALGVRLHRLEAPMCPRFHVDRVGVRLLCTYAGLGTQWLDDADAPRELLGPGAAGRSDEESGLVRDPALVHEVMPMAIALLKGESYPGNAGHGVIHRSPHANKPRLLFSLDGLWEQN